MSQPVERTVPALLKADRADAKEHSARQVASRPSDCWTGSFLWFPRPGRARRPSRIRLGLARRQHGQFTDATLNDSLARFLAVDSTPVVRVNAHEPGAIGRVLDMGAMGVIAPMVQNAQEAHSERD